MSTSIAQVSTLHDLRLYLSLLVDETIDDNILQRLLESAGRLISSYLGQRRLLPWVELRLLPFSSTWGEVEFDQDLLELLEISSGDTGVIPSEDFLLQTQGFWPKARMILSNDSTYLLDEGGDPSISQEVSGVWGYHEDYDNAWIDSLDKVVNDPLLIDGTSITIEDLDGETYDFRSPRFLRGHLLRLQDIDNFELVEVVKGVPGDDSVADTITVYRGVRGSTAREWPKETQIELWRSDLPSELAVQELVRVLYFLRQTDFQGIQQVLGTGVVITPQTFPDHVADLLPTPRFEL